MNLTRRKGAIQFHITAPAVLPNLYNWAVFTYTAGEGFCAYRSDGGGADGVSRTCTFNPTAQR